MRHRFSPPRVLHEPGDKALGGECSCSCSLQEESDRDGTPPRLAGQHGFAAAQAPRQAPQGQAQVQAPGDDARDSAAREPPPPVAVSLSLFDMDAVPLPGTRSVLRQPPTTAAADAAAPTAMATDIDGAPREQEQAPGDGGQAAAGQLAGDPSQPAQGGGGPP